MTDFCTLAQVKDYLKITTTAEDAVISRVITDASDWIVTFCGRDFGSNIGQTFYLNGTGSKRLPLPQDIQSITTLGVMYYENDPGGYHSVPSSVSTTVAGPVSMGQQTITPASMSGLVAGAGLRVNFGLDDSEVVRIISVTATTLTAVFTKAHTGTIALEQQPDFFLEPQNELLPGWPYQWIEFGLLPTTSIGAFYRGHRTIKIVGNTGWAAVPASIVEATVQIVSAIQKRRQAGFLDTVGTTELGTPIIGRFVPEFVRKTLSMFTELHIGSSAPSGA